MEERKPITYGYVRVSTKEQNESRQLIALANFPVAQENIFMDKQSGKNFERPAYQRLLKKISEDDVLVIQSIDRLGRNYEEILEQWRMLTRKKGIDVVVLDMPLLDTRDKSRDLTGIFVADLVLQILSYVAQKERENIRKRQAEGIAAARRRGVRFGNPGKPLPKDFEEVAGKWRRKEIALPIALNELGIGRTYFFKHIKELGI